MNKEKEDIKMKIKDLFNKIAPSWGEIGPKYWNDFVYAFCSSFVYILP